MNLDKLILQQKQIKEKWQQLEIYADFMPCFATKKIKKYIYIRKKTARTVDFFF